MKTNTLAKEEQQILTPEQTELSKLSIDYSWLKGEKINGPSEMTQLTWITLQSISSKCVLPMLQLCLRDLLLEL